MDYQNKCMQTKLIYHKLKNQLGGKKQLIVHISGPQGAGKTTLGNKLKDKFCDKIFVKDLDDLRAEFNRQKQINDFQKYMERFDFEGKLYYVQNH